MRGGCRGAAGFTLVELLIVLAVIGIIAAMATVRLDRARAAASESSAIGSLRAINAAESTYASSCGGSGFAQSLDDLAKPPAGSAHGFISEDLSRNGVAKSGYQISVVADAGASLVTEPARACNSPAEPALSSYFSSAVPVTTGGSRAFASNKIGAIYARENGEAIEPGMSGATVLR